jgi:hypothetical protein
MQPSFFVLILILVFKKRRCSRRDWHILDCSCGTKFNSACVLGFHLNMLNFMLEPPMVFTSFIVKTAKAFYKQNYGIQPLLGESALILLT